MPPTVSLTNADDFAQTNILIDRDFHPRLTDYGLVAIISDPNTVDPGNTTSPPVGTVRYMAPELLNPSGFGLKNSNPTKRSDVYAFGIVMYQVISAYSVSGLRLKLASRLSRGCNPSSGPRMGSLYIVSLLENDRAGPWVLTSGFQTLSGALSRGVGLHPGTGAPI